MALGASRCAMDRRASAPFRGPDRGTVRALATVPRSTSTASPVSDAGTTPDTQSGNGCVLDPSCGRPPDVATSAEPLDLALPAMGTAKECSAALEQVASALCEGRVSLDAAHTLVDLVAARIKGIETLEIEQRLLALERSFDAVELDQRRR